MASAPPQVRLDDTAHESSLLPLGRSVIRQQAEALLLLGEHLDSHFDAAVSAICTRPAGARVLVTGIGKAGYIGMKLSATLASLGIPSYFVHPSEAVHGDLGRYHPHDIALFVSNSGETSEILRIIPAVKGRGCVIISLTADANSSLGRASDIVLTIGRVEESAPLGIAPTTSTTVLLALGDALSMAVASRHGITRQSYAQFHPGGDIGRNLMTVREIMRTGEEHCIVRETLTAREVLRQYISTPGRPGAATVVDDAGVLVGIFTDGDLRRRLYEGIEFLEEQVASVMGRSPKTVRPSQLAREALNLLVTYEIDQVIVVDDHHRPVGLVDIQDLARIFG